MWRVLCHTLSRLCVPFDPHLARRGSWKPRLGVRSPLSRVKAHGAASHQLSMWVQPWGERGSVHCVRGGRPGGMCLRRTPSPPVRRRWRPVPAPGRAASETRGGCDLPSVQQARPCPCLLTLGSHCSLGFMQPSLQTCPPHLPGVLSLWLTVARHGACGGAHPPPGG